MGRGAAVHRNAIAAPPRFPSPADFLCRSYAGGPAVGSNSYASWLFIRQRRGPMLDLILLIGFAVFCLLIVYGRLSNRL
jgi:hypothetical protein